MNENPAIIVRRKAGFGAPGTMAIAPDLECLPPSLRVLIVEDEADAADMLRSQLVSWGLAPWVTHSGHRVLELARAYRPHAVLLDLFLPDLHGFDIARQLHSQTWGQGIVIVAVTGWGNEADRAQGRAAGINHHLVKPVDPGALHLLLADLTPDS